MKKVLLLSLLCIYSYYTNAQDFKVEIWQNDKKLKTKKGIVKLEKAPFQIKLTLQDIDGVYVVPTFTGELPQTIKNNFKYLSGFVMGGEAFNLDRNLEVQEDIVHFLFFNPEKDWHRFDKNGVKQTGSTITGLRTVATLVVGTEDKIVPVQYIEEDLYLIFMITTKKEGARYIATGILKQEKLHLKWK